MLCTRCDCPMTGETSKAFFSSLNNTCEDCQEKIELNLKSDNERKENE
jgi:hypothetical protein